MYNIIHTILISLKKVGNHSADSSVDNCSSPSHILLPNVPYSYGRKNDDTLMRLASKKASFRIFKRNKLFEYEIPWLVSDNLFFNIFKEKKQKKKCPQRFSCTFLGITVPVQILRCEGT
jgi:hypothetical protein